jgi:hypothetical protein
MSQFWFGGYAPTTSKSPLASSLQCPVPEGRDCDISSPYDNLMTILTAQHQSCMTTGKAQRLMSGRVVMVKVEDAIAPLWGPSVAQKRGLENGCPIGSCGRNRFSINQHWEMLVIRHPSIARKLQRLRA